VDFKLYYDVHIPTLAPCIIILLPVHITIHVKVMLKLLYSIVHIFYLEFPAQLFVQLVFFNLLTGIIWKSTQRHHRFNMLVKYVNMVQVNSAFFAIATYNNTLAIAVL